MNFKEILIPRYIRDVFITGIFVLLPIGITLWVVISLLSFVNNLVLPYLRYLLPIPDIPGLGVLTTLLLVFLTGLVAQNYIGKRLIELWDRIVARIPLVRTIYSATKQTMESLFAKKDNFQKTVLIEFPRKGTLSIAFVANEIKICDENYYVVYVPTAPNPTSGYTIFVKKDEVIHTDMTVDEATRIILSGGLVIKRNIKLPSRDDVEIQILSDKN